MGAIGSKMGKKFKQKRKANLVQGLNKMMSAVII